MRQVVSPEATTVCIYSRSPHIAATVPPTITATNAADRHL